MVINRFEVWLINLDPTQGSEINKTRPCVVVSPNELNDNIRTVMVAPLTSALKPYPTRVECFFEGKNGQVALDQIRTVDKTRLIRNICKLDESTCQEICARLQSLFEY